MSIKTTWSRCLLLWRVIHSYFTLFSWMLFPYQKQQVDSSSLEHIFLTQDDEEFGPVSSKAFSSSKSKLNQSKTLKPLTIYGRLRASRYFWHSKVFSIENSTTFHFKRDILCLVFQAFARLFGCNPFSLELGISHGDELFLLFKPHVIPLNTRFTTSDIQTSQNLVNIWTGFASHHKFTLHHSR